MGFRNYDYTRHENIKDVDPHDSVGRAARNADSDADSERGHAG